MSEGPAPMRGFRASLITIGVLYVMLASSMLLRGVGIMRDFAAPEGLLSEPMFEDFFLFFYELMAAVGVLIAVFGQVVRDRKGQTVVALVLFLFKAYVTWRDLSTSDSAFGNHLYRGSATLIPVFIDLAIALVFAGYAWAGLRGAGAARSGRESAP
jgi:hypothetical protein